MSNEKPVNHVSLIWSIAEILRGDYKEHEYGDVILPFTVLTRLDSALESTKAEVLEIEASSTPPRSKRSNTSGLLAIRSGTRRNSRFALSSMTRTI